MARRAVNYGVDCAATDSWANFEFPGWQSAGWTAWKAKDPSRRLVYAPGMGVAQDIDGGAAGAYDSEWTALGQRLVAAGMDDAVIRIAHEFSGNWYWYQPQGQQAQPFTPSRRAGALLGDLQRSLRFRRTRSTVPLRFSPSSNLAQNDSRLT